VRPLTLWTIREDYVGPRPREEGIWAVFRTHEEVCNGSYTVSDIHFKSSATWYHVTEIFLNFACRGNRFSALDTLHNSCPSHHVIFMCFNAWFHLFFFSFFFSWAVDLRPANERLGARLFPKLLPLRLSFDPSLILIMAVLTLTTVRLGLRSLFPALPCQS
jgi:hypothetical protein